MPRTYFGPFNENYSTYAYEKHANLGRFPLGSTLILPDGREYKFTLNDGTVEISGDAESCKNAVAGHTDVVATVAAIGATSVSGTMSATAAAVDIYTEGMVHVGDETGEGYSFRIKRAMTEGAAHAAATSTGTLTVNFEAGEKLQVAIDTTSDLTFTRNRYHSAMIHGSPPTALLTGISPGVCAASRFYWSQVKGYAACYVNTGNPVLAGLPVQASISVDGQIEGYKRRVRTTGTTVLFVTTGLWGCALTDQDGGAVAGLYAIASTNAIAPATYDITGAIAYNAPQIGMCVKANISTEYALIDLNIN